MVFSQHWYVWLFFIPAILCSVRAANAATKNLGANMSWYLIMTAAWSGLIYYNWQ